MTKKIVKKITKKKKIVQPTEKEVCDWAAQMFFESLIETPKRGAKL